MGEKKENQKALLVVSFGTSYEETRRKTIDALEQDLSEAFPDRCFYRAWTSKRIVKKLKESSGCHIDDMDEALARMRDDGIRDVLVALTVLTKGREYQKILNALGAYRTVFDVIAVSRPLLFCPEDIPALAKVLEDIFGGADRKDMVAFMGHGNAFDRLGVYERLDACFKQDGYSHFCVGTAEYAPGFEPVLRQVRETKPENVRLSPLLVVAGEHAQNDLAGAGRDSWKSQIEREGYRTQCILKGLGEYPQIRELYVLHAKSAQSYISSAQDSFIKEIL